MVDETYRERSGSSLTTLLGVLTALAAVVTAVGGLYLGFRGGADQSHAFDDTNEEPTVPDAPRWQEVDPSQINVTNLNGIDTDDLGDGVDSTIDDCANGSLDACIVLLDQLAVDCFDGFWLSCDVLYLVSPAGSDYEWFGGTCGGSFAEPYDGYCADV